VTIKLVLVSQKLRKKQREEKV